MAGSPHNIITIYREWANSILCEQGLQIKSISDLIPSCLLPKLYVILRHTEWKTTEVANEIKRFDAYDQRAGESVAEVLRLIRSDGIRVNITPSDLVSGDIHSLLELIWILILNYSIHPHGSVKTSQRTLSIGAKLLLQWSSELLNGACFDYRLSMTENMEKDILHNLVNTVTGLVSDSNEPEPCDYYEAVAEAERKLGISSNLLRTCGGSSEDLAITVYISLLRRKRELILKGASPTQPCVFVHQLPQDSPNPFSAIAERNDRTQQVLKEIEKQLEIFQMDKSSKSLNISQNGKESSLYHEVSAVTDDDTDCSDTGSDEPKLSDKQNGASSKEHTRLKLDLYKLTSKSITNQHHPSNSSTKEFTELFRQVKENGVGIKGKRAMPTLLVDTQTGDQKVRKSDDESTSPKSAPTDEGFGTFTKTTPRDKDSLGSDVSDEHTDCDTDHLADPVEANSITEWWDKIELPTEVATLETFTPSKQMDRTRLSDNGSVELHEDELMCMIDNIGMTGLKASTSLAVAQETELRLLHILKERDDLVLSYHTALKELSKLTARIKDENHLLRRQLNMTDLSHSEIVLALEEQASAGRQLALSLQDDLTDTELNVVSKLREDRLVLVDRLAALEHQYNTDLSKWKAELLFYKSSLEDKKSGAEEQLVEENETLRGQITEMRHLYETTISQTQDECKTYLSTIDQLKEQMSSSKAPISEMHLETLATRQAEMENLYESAINSLETENKQLQSNLLELQKDIERINASKNMRNSIGIGTESPKSHKSVEACYMVSEKGCGTYESPSLVNKYVLTDSVEMVGKGVETDEDVRTTEVQSLNNQLKLKLSQLTSENESLSQQRESLLASHKQLCEKFSELQSELQFSQHKWSTLQAVHELVLSKNENLEKNLTEEKLHSSTLSTKLEKIQTQYAIEIDKQRVSSSQQQAECNALKKQLSILQEDNSSSKRREVDLNAELTKLTLDRSSLQHKVNSLSTEAVQQKTQLLSQTMKIKQLETANNKLETEVSTFKNDSLDLLRELENLRQEKDSLTQHLDSLHERLTDAAESWENKFSLLSQDHMTEKQRLEEVLSSQQMLIDEVSKDKITLTAEVTHLNKHLKDAEEKYERDRQQLNEVIRTAKLDSRSADVLEQLNEQLKSLKQQVGEFQFTTAHFRSENSSLQLRVNQLEELNKSLETRSTILQNELSIVQSNLDDSINAQDNQLNILDMSASEITSETEVSQLRNYLLAAKRQVEMMQSKRTKTNLEYSRKISEMEKLLKEKQADVSRPHNSSPNHLTPPSPVPGYVTPNKINASQMLAASRTSTPSIEQPQFQTHSMRRTSTPSMEKQQVHADLTRRTQSNAISDLPIYPNGTHFVKRVPYEVPSSTVNAGLSETPKDFQPTAYALSSHAPSSHDGDDELPDRLSQKVRLLTNGYSSSDDVEKSLKAHTRRSPPQAISADTKPVMKPPPAVSECHMMGYMTPFELENAALRKELEMINSDRNHFHQHLMDQDEKHDALNETLDELERSLEEIQDSNKLLRETLQKSNEFIQKNLLETPKSATPLHNVKQTYNSENYKMESRQMYDSIERHPDPAVSSSRLSLSQTSTSNKGLFTNTRGLQSERSYGNIEQMGWSINSNKSLMSSADFNKLQQTNVQNYESLLHSETNSRSPTKRGNTSQRKSTDLNQMIQHSLTQLNQINTPVGMSPFGSQSIDNRLTSTPLRSRFASTPTNPAYI